METTVYGYVRVSSKDQNEDRQLIAMEHFGVPQRRIHATGERILLQRKESK